MNDSSEIKFRAFLEDLFPEGECRRPVQYAVAEIEKSRVDNFAQSVGLLDEELDEFHRTFNEFTSERIVESEAQRPSSESFGSVRTVRRNFGEVGAAARGATRASDSGGVAIEIGGSSIRIYMKGEGIVLHEPSIVACCLKGKKREVVAVGEDAKLMLGRTPGSMEAIWPMREGVIADVDVAEKMIEHFLHKVHKRTRLSNSNIVVCLPQGVTPIEKSGIRQAVLKAGALRAGFIAEPIAAAIGAGMPITDPSGSMVVDIGGGTTEIAVLSLGDIVYARSVRVGGDRMDEAIISYLRREQDLLVAESTAEHVKTTIGTGRTPDEGGGASIQIRGHDLFNGVPKETEINQAQVAEALAETIQQISEAVMTALEATPPDLAADIVDRGVTMTGGGALLGELDLILRERTGLTISVASESLYCSIRGSARALNYEQEVLHLLEFSS